MTIFSGRFAPSIIRMIFVVERIQAVDSDDAKGALN